MHVSWTSVTGDGTSIYGDMMPPGKARYVRDAFFAYHRGDPHIHFASLIPGIT